ncbi:hypothetical protein HPB49_015604 [Dermacentor silvarum]|uniref:Uncharacterized protein n=1 Tax=Dermacentor silvarum TaxID=543639 RepID=A0ACB8CLJ3_DERSI|nr:hypothetical protein HPB49_015604 [Dermacentor silvarum]
MNSKGAWRLFRSLIDPTQTRGETQKQLRRALQGFHGTNSQLADALCDKYLCRMLDPDKTAYEYAGRENHQLDAPFAMHDLKAALGKMRRGTAPGRDHITGESQELERGCVFWRNACCVRKNESRRHNTSSPLSSALGSGPEVVCDSLGRRRVIWIAVWLVFSPGSDAGIGGVGSGANPRASEWMATRGRTAPSGFQRTECRANLRDHFTLLAPGSRATGLQPPLELTVPCCHGQYYLSIPTALPTTIVPVREQAMMSSKFSACHDNIEWQATSDEQLAALTIPPLIPQPPLSGELLLRASAGRQDRAAGRSSLRPIISVPAAGARRPAFRPRQMVFLLVTQPHSPASTNAL